jgi:hypothetical protein
MSTLNFALPRPNPGRAAQALTLLLLGWTLGHASPGLARDCDTRAYPIHQRIERDQSFELTVPAAYVQSIAVSWNDAIGRRHEARGEVFLDGARLGSDDIKAAGNVSVFRAERYARLGRVTVRIRRDDAFIRSVEAVLCKGERGEAYGPQSLSGTARNLLERVRHVRGDAGQEGYGEGQRDALRDLAALEGSAEDFSRSVEEGHRGGRHASHAYRRLQDDYREAARSMERAHFSGRVQIQWQAVGHLMHRLDEQFGSEQGYRRWDHERDWNERHHWDER